MTRSRIDALIAALAAVVAAPPARAQPPLEPAVIYLNFSDGTESLQRGDMDDATRNQSSLGAATPYPAFTWPGLADGTISRRELVRTITRRVHEAFLPYNVVLTLSRPAAGQYTMVLIGGSPTLFGFDAKVAGLAPMDCGNQTASNVVFTFPPALRGNVHGLFATVAQEAAHAYGLEHTTDPTDLMFPRVDPAQRRFQERASRIDGERLCGREIQSSHERLLEILGPWPADRPKPLDDGGQADTTPPAIAFHEPAAGAVVAQPFVVRAAVEDDGAIDEVTVEAGGTRLAALRPPFAWSLDGFPAGPLAITATAVDGSGNRSTATVEVTVSPGGAGGCALAGGGARRVDPGVAALLWLALCAVRACSGGVRRL